MTPGQPLQLGCIDNEDMEEKGTLLNDYISNEAACRTALVTPGLLKISLFYSRKKLKQEKLSIHSRF